ncbi:MAG: hybrid sensor histidine kinase/response regulator [Beggiatoa sp. IS2]|nr:MAG: hybrid sensor histidine kinase/response regulator [Beggiatoa sp. IS2]
MDDKISEQGTLLIVDDTPANVSVLFDFLSESGFKVLVAQDGKRAIQKASYAQPDLILLDVMMPGMDGFEACVLLKSQEKTKDIPIIFMTALADTVDKVKGFSLGASDYITKPIQHEEVLARVSTHLKFRKLQLQLQLHSVELEKRNQELDAFARTVAHDLKNPLNAIIGYTDILLTDCSPNTLPDKTSIEQLQLVAQAGHKMVNIIDALLLLAGVSTQLQVEKQPLAMGEILTQVIYQRLPYMVKEYQGNIQLHDHWPVARGYAPWVEEVWMNYISNGLKYGGRPPQLEIGATLQNDHAVRFWVRDNGPGLSAEAQAKLFTPFMRLHQDYVEGHGLGLSIVQQIVEKLGGQVGVESTPGQGSTFYFTLPAS